MKLVKQSILKFILFALFLSIQVFSFSQLNKSERLFEKALNQFHLGKYKSAIRSAEKIIESDSTFIDAYILLGNINEEQHKIKEAILYYNQVFSQLSQEHKNTCIHAIELKVNVNQFESAIDDCFKLLNSKDLDKEDIQHITHLRNLAEFRLSAYANPVDYNPVNLGGNVNTEAHEYINAFYTVNDKLLFTRKRQSSFYANEMVYDELLLAAIFKDQSWEQLMIPEIPDGQNHRLGASTISSDGRYLLFTACYRPDGYGNCDLYYIDLWADSVVMQNMGPKINTNAWESQPHFSADGQSLYFASKRNGGYGGSDLWMCKLDDKGYWSNAINLGPKINTREDEMAPFMHPDGHSFYFSSKGHIGMGGFDLFRSKIDTSFSTARNLGYPINTNADEINLIISNNGITSYISAERKDGFGGIDMYEFEMEEEHRAYPIKVLNGKVIDAKSKDALIATVQLNHLGESDIFAQAISKKETGEFRILIPDTSLSLSIFKADYLFYSMNISSNTSLSDTLIFALQKIEVGVLTKLENVFFNTDRYNLKETSFVELNKIAKFLNTNPSLNVEIGGHTDDTGSSEYNITLSERRAKAVVDYLITNGISASRIKSKGYGLSIPLVPNDSDANRAINRRTEIKITGI